ncbi:hypothetical protein AYI69_g1736 [Smittium culicis]|uniref:YMC020W-like alpha/beta hydrolase domain-containing protein n=1 Tax=Smittium culicis TaxID=133412 RepID=A0A1R1YPF5_9FUNG|nr:hypothetical protein AYI69_g1736 [Smittium culicis]
MEINSKRLSNNHSVKSFIINDAEISAQDISFDLDKKTIVEAPQLKSHKSLALAQLIDLSAKSESLPSKKKQNVVLSSSPVIEIYHNKNKDINSQTKTKIGFSNSKKDISESILNFSTSNVESENTPDKSSSKSKKISTFGTWPWKSNIKYSNSELSINEGTGEMPAKSLIDSNLLNKDLSITQPEFFSEQTEFSNDKLESQPKIITKKCNTNELISVNQTSPSTSGSSPPKLYKIQNATLENLQTNKTEIKASFNRMSDQESVNNNNKYDSISHLDVVEDKSLSWFWWNRSKIPIKNNKNGSNSQESSKFENDINPDLMISSLENTTGESKKNSNDSKNSFCEIQEPNEISIDNIDMPGALDAKNSNKVAENNDYIPTNLHLLKVQESQKWSFFFFRSSTIENHSDTNQQQTLELTINDDLNENFEQNIPDDLVNDHEQTNSVNQSSSSTLKLDPASGSEKKAGTAKKDVLSDINGSIVEPKLVFQTNHIEDNNLISDIKAKCRFSLARKMFNGIKSMIYYPLEGRFLGLQETLYSLSNNQHEQSPPINLKSRSPQENSIHNAAESVKKVVIIGIHGWFPNKLVQMVAGEPTGRSEKFCDKMKSSMLDYLLEEHGIEFEESSLVVMPLVAQGKIEFRVEKLLDQLIFYDEVEEIECSEPPPESNNIKKEKIKIIEKSRATSSLQKSTKGIPNFEKIDKKIRSDSVTESINSLNFNKLPIDTAVPNKKERVKLISEADTVLVVTHSQGTPVSVLVLDRLIELGIVKPRKQRVGMLAMAGINHGPFPGLKDNVVIKYIEHDAARELFLFNDPTSDLVMVYISALGAILQKGVRLVCVASWVDEVVPFHSALMHSVSHPNIYRAVCVSSPIKPSFLTKLAIFLIKLRNAGLSDYDLALYISESIAGTLWPGAVSGHSSIYEEEEVYKLMFKWLLYSSSSLPPVVEPDDGYFENFLGVKNGFFGKNKKFSEQNFNRSNESDTQIGCIESISTNIFTFFGNVFNLATYGYKWTFSKTGSLLLNVYSLIRRRRIRQYQDGVNNRLLGEIESDDSDSASSNVNRLFSSHSGAHSSTDFGTTKMEDIHPSLYSEFNRQSTSKVSTDLKKSDINIKFNKINPLMTYSPFDAKKILNPYYLPWIMRRICASKTINSNPEFRHDLVELISEYQHWEPESKAEKLLKHQLEPLKSMYF